MKPLFTQDDINAAVAAERERCANFSEGAVLDEMRRLDPNWNGYGQSRSAALATAFKALRRMIAGPNVLYTVPAETLHKK